MYGYVYISNWFQKLTNESPNYYATTSYNRNHESKLKAYILWQASGPYVAQPRLDASSENPRESPTDIE